MVCIVYGEISEGSAPSSPPLDPPLTSLIEVENVDSTVWYWSGFFDEFYKLMLA